MSWYHLVAYFVAGALFANALPHLIAGVSGLRSARALSVAFARKPGLRTSRLDDVGFRSLRPGTRGRYRG